MPIKARTDSGKASLMECRGELKALQSEGKYQERRIGILGFARMGYGTKPVRMVSLPTVLYRLMGKGLQWPGP